MSDLQELKNETPQAYNMSKKEIVMAKEIAESIVVLGGPDLRNLSDRELIERLNKMIEELFIAFEKMTVTTDEATKAFNYLGKVARKIEWDVKA